MESLVKTTRPKTLKIPETKTKLIIFSNWHTNKKIKNQFHLTLHILRMIENATIFSSNTLDSFFRGDVERSLQSTIGWREM